MRSESNAVQSNVPRPSGSVGIKSMTFDRLVGCTTTAHYDEPQPMDFPSSISACKIHDLMIKGRRYTMTVHYDNSQPYTAVMGIMLAYVWQGTPPPG